MTKRVLVVEDDLLNRMFLTAGLRGEGFDIREVDDGQHVLQAASEFRPDLVTMDINIPNVSGLKLIRKLRKDPHFKDIPILAITAYAGIRDEENIRNAGASDYLAKPVALHMFLDSVDRLLGEPASE